MAEITIPSVGIAMDEALLLDWLRQPGEEVAAGDVVAEIETDKATMELTSPAEGKLGPHLFEVGAVIPVGTAIVHVLTEAENGDSATHETAEPSAVVAVEPEGAPGAGIPPVALEGSHQVHRLSPRARRLAREGDAEDSPRSDRFRQLIASKVAESWREIPHFAVTREIDAESLLAALERLRSSAADPVSTLTDLLIRTLALGLRDSGFQEPSDVGLAVATDYGVVIPVIRDALTLDATALAHARTSAVQRARAGRLSPEDLEANPTCTLSNLGSYGVDHFTGIIALGQRSLLTVGRAVPRVVADDNRTLRIRTTFFATLNVDHRILDGAQAARLLAAISTAAESMSPAF